MSTSNGVTATAEREAVTEPEAVVAITLQRLRRKEVHLPVVGTAPLITHRWDEKARKMLLGKQQGAVKVREKKNPEADFKASLYTLEDGSYGLPAVAFKAAIVSAARFFKGSIQMVTLKQAIHVVGEGKDGLVRIKGEPEKYEAMVRVGVGVADIRYRGKFWPWSTVLRIQFLESVLPEESLAALVDAAGNAGVGEWRPSSPKGLSGSFGTFMLDVAALGEEAGRLGFGS